MGGAAIGVGTLQANYLGWRYCDKPICAAGSKTPNSVLGSPLQKLWGIFRFLVALLA